MFGLPMDLSYSNTSMNFTENQQGSAILDKLRHQKDVNRFCDAVFSVNNKEYTAHRCVLAACSPYFETMLIKSDSSPNETISVKCENNSVFEILLNYVYTGKVVIDGNIISSRGPDDLPAFCRAIINVLSTNNL